MYILDLRLCSFVFRAFFKLLSCVDTFCILRLKKNTVFRNIALFAKFAFKKKSNPSKKPTHM